MRSHLMKRRTSSSLSLLLSSYQGRHVLSVLDSGKDHWPSVAGIFRQGMMIEPARLLAPCSQPGGSRASLRGLTLRIRALKQSVGHFGLAPVFKARSDLPERGSHSRAKPPCENEEISEQDSSETAGPKCLAGSTILLRGIARLWTALLSRYRRSPLEIEVLYLCLANPWNSAALAFEVAPTHDNWNKEVNRTKDESLGLESEPTHRKVEKGGKSKAALALEVAPTHIITPGGVRTQPGAALALGAAIFPSPD